MCSGSSVCTCEGELDSTHDGGWRSSSYVMSTGRDAEGRVSADGVREMLILSFPCATLFVERQISGEEEDARANFTSCAHPVSMETYRLVLLGWQDGRMMKIGRSNHLTNSAVTVIGLKAREYKSFWTETLMILIFRCCWTTLHINSTWKATNKSSVYCSIIQTKHWRDPFNISITSSRHH